MQKVTQKLADLCSWRHGGYRNLMIRIQKFIVGLKNHERKLRGEEKEDPFWGRGEREGLHTKKIGVCRPGGRVNVLEHDSSPPNVVRDKSETHRSHKDTQLPGKYIVARRRRGRRRWNNMVGTVSAICKGRW